MTSDDVRLTFGGAGLLDRLEPLWLALFDHHAAVGGAGLPLIDRAGSWPLRRAFYAKHLATPDSFVLLANRGDRAVGYVLAHVEDGADDTWPTSDRIGHVETLALLPAERGHGLGGRLLDAAEDRLASVGATTVMLSALVGNDGALRFYERRGMVPIATWLMRLGPRPAQNG